MAIENARLHGELKDRIEELNRAEEALEKLNLKLEKRVKQRATELSKINKLLKQEIAESKEMVNQRNRSWPCHLSSISRTNEWAYVGGK